MDKEEEDYYIYGRWPEDTGDGRLRARGGGWRAKEEERKRGRRGLDKFLEQQQERYQD